MTQLYPSWLMSKGLDILLHGYLLKNVCAILLIARKWKQSKSPPINELMMTM